MVQTTRAQREALHEVWKRRIRGNPNPMTYKQFRKTVMPGIGFIMVPWAGMILGIEPDGYTHS